MTRLTPILIFIATSFLFISGAYAHDKLIFAIDIIRHGDRTPTINIPTVNYDWPQGLGQLTSRGMLQENKLGASQRNLYVNQYHLLPEKYVPGTLYVRSSDFDRTLMSAQSFLLGLYPLGTGSTLPGQFQPIPIHTVSKAEENLLVPDTESDTFDVLLQRYVYPTAEWKMKESELQSHFPAWSDATGLNIHSLRQFISIGDALFIQQLYDVPFPKHLSQSDVNQMIAAGQWVLAAQFRNPNIGKMTGRNLLNKIISQLQEASSEKSPLKYVLYSAHDSTILMELSAMGAPLNQPPKYASDLNILLFKKSHHHYIVKVRYNNEPVIIPLCGGAECRLEQFVKL